MGAIVVYIVKSAVCLILFYLFFKLLLSKDTFHRFNRIALLSLLLLSFVIPLGEISLSPSSEVKQEMAAVENVVMQAGPVGIVQIAGVDAPVETPPWWILVLILTYLAGIVFFFSHRLWSLVSMFKLMCDSRQSAMGLDATVLVHSKNIAPFSWMKYIVLSEKDLEENGKEILIHELAHIHQKHSWDLIVADCCIYFQWFNPAAWLLKQELQSIHEFEADEVVLHQGIDAKQYQLLIIKKAVGTRLYSMANSFNHSSLKKRITMMLKEKSNPLARLKYLYVLPLACVTMLAFAQPDVSRVEENSIEKVNDLMALAPSETRSYEHQSSDKINELSGYGNPEEVKKVEGQPLSAIGDLLALHAEKAPESSGQEPAIKAPVPVASALHVRGFVFHSTGNQALSSVSVAEVDPSGRMVGAAVTKDDGTFDLDVKNSGNKLRFSLIGFKTTECPAKQFMKVLMSEAVLSLDETVVVGYAASSEKKEAAPLNQDGTVTLVEQMPQFPGGEKALMEYIRKTVKYPASASAKGKEGRVVCSCVVSAEGMVTDVRVVASVDPDLDQEARRVVEKMPDWIPGRQNGQHIPVTFSIPILFKINK